MPKFKPVGHSWIIKLSNNILVETWYLIPSFLRICKKIRYWRKKTYLSLLNLANKYDFTSKYPHAAFPVYSSTVTLVNSKFKYLNVLWYVILCHIKLRHMRNFSICSKKKIGPFIYSVGCDVKNTTPRSNVSCQLKGVYVQTFQTYLKTIIKISFFLFIWK